MTGNTHIVELMAQKDLTGDEKFAATFAPTKVHELMLEFDPKRSGAPLAVLAAGPATKEVHPLPLRGREGRFMARVGGEEAWTAITVSMLRGTKGKLVKVKLIGVPA